MTTDTITVAQLFVPSQARANNNSTRSVGRSSSPATAALSAASQPVPRNSAPLAHQIVRTVNRSSSLSSAYKREVVILAAFIDSAAPQAQRQVLLQSLSSEVARQEAAAGGDTSENGVDTTLTQLFSDVRAATSPAPAATEEDRITLSPTAQGRAVAESIQTPEGQEALAHLEKNPAFLELLPHKRAEAFDARQAAILSRITAGKLP